MVNSQAALFVMCNANEWKSSQAISSALGFVGVSLTMYVHSRGVVLKQIVWERNYVL